MNKDVTQEEFEVMLMLYVANSDGRVDPEEVRLILEKTTPEVFVDVKRRFAKMNDTEVLQCLEENRMKYATTEESRRQLISDLKALIEADGKLHPVEEYILNAISSRL